ncbi:hypothetical protein BDA96_02G155100, partial [Sorghum bicolor]
HESHGFPTVTLPSSSPAPTLGAAPACEPRSPPLTAPPPRQPSQLNPHPVAIQSNQVPQAMEPHGRRSSPPSRMEVWQQVLLPAVRPSKCFHCLSTGHAAAECRDPVRCFTCGRWGHKSRECRDRASAKQQAPQPPTTPPLVDDQHFPPLGRTAMLESVVSTEFSILELA